MKGELCLSCEQGEKRLNPWLHPSANHTMCQPITDCVHQTQTVSTSHRLCPPVTGCVHQSQSVSANHRMCSPITECVHQSQDVLINHRLCPPIGIILRIRFRVVFTISYFMNAKCDLRHRVRSSL